MSIGSENCKVSKPVLEIDSIEADKFFGGPRDALSSLFESPMTGFLFLSLGSESPSSLPYPKPLSKLSV
jgi:hypothetical protein